MPTVHRYNCLWPEDDKLGIEIACVRKGGEWEGAGGKKCGAGLLTHYRNINAILWPSKREYMPNRWDELLFKQFLSKKVVGIMGPASSGKSNSIARYAIVSYICYPDETTILVSSTTRELLELRVWGEIKKYYIKAKERFPHLPGHCLEYRQMITTDGKEVPGRDFRNGIIGLACKVGNTFVGLSCFLEGTKVETPWGSRPIERVKVGDLVLTGTGKARVTKLFNRREEKLVRITLRDGRSFVCTQNHPILTTSGWVTAIDITPQHMVVSRYETLQVMRQAHTGDRSPQGDLLLSALQDAAEGKAVLPVRKTVHTFRRSRGVLLSGMRGDVEMEATGVPGKSLCKPRQRGHGEEGESDPSCQPRGTQATFRTDGEDVKREELCQAELENSARHGSKSFRLSRQRSTPQSGGADFSGALSGSEVRANHPFSPGSVYVSAKDQVPALLQTGLRVYGRETRRGNRRRITRPTSPAGQRQKEATSSYGTRVDRVEVYQPASGPGHNQREGNYRVYDLEIKGVGTYVVEGVVMHNSYAGIKNNRVILCADEASFMPRGFYDSISNLDANPFFQLIAAGNPKDPTDALGMICEPHADEGGWDGLDPSERTKTWKTRIPDGVAIQLVGTDSPNFDFPPPEEGKHEPFPWLIGRKKIEKNIALYGKESMQYQMMCLGMLPKGGSARRVITRQLCIQHHALEDPIWSGQDTRVKVMGLDAAYGSVGGDRCVAGELDFARDKDGRLILAFIGSPIIVPVDGRKKMEPEDQIALFMQAELGKRGIPIANLGFDATGKGTLAMAFARLGMDQAYAIEYGGDPTDRPVRQGETRRCKDAYSKFVTELWYSVRLIIEAGQFRGLPEEVMDEGCMREWRILQNGKVELEKKQDTKDRMGRSPDLFDMLVAGVEVARRRGFAIGAPNPASRRTPNWMLAYQQRMNQLNRNHALVYR